jgi:hypothetical protein
MILHNKLLIFLELGYRNSQEFINSTTGVILIPKVEPELHPGHGNADALVCYPMQPKPDIYFTAITTLE